MFYRAVNKFTNEMWESESFREVYEQALKAGKYDMYCDPDRWYTAFRLQRVEGAIDLVNDETGEEITYYFGVKQIGYLQVTDFSVLIIYYGQNSCEWKKRW